MVVIEVPTGFRIELGFADSLNRARQSAKAPASLRLQLGYAKQMACLK